MASELPWEKVGSQKPTQKNNTNIWAKIRFNLMVKLTKTKVSGMIEVFFKKQFYF
jgi:hypothetical protein